MAKLTPDQRQNLDRAPSTEVGTNSPLSSRPRVDAAGRPVQAVPITPDVAPVQVILTPEEFGAYKNNTKFVHPNDVVLLDIYDRSGNYLETLPNDDKDTAEFSITQDGRLSIDLEDQLKKYNYLAGEFTVDLRAVRNYLGSFNGPKLIIQEISNDRLEFRAIPAITSGIVDSVYELTPNDFAFQSFFATDFLQFDKKKILPGLKVNWSLQQSAEIFDYVQDKFTIQTSPYSIIFKLITPLPSNLTIDSFIWVTQDVTETITQNVIILPELPQTKKTYIAGPNFDVNIKKGLQQPTDYKNWNTILAYASSSILTAMSQSQVEGVPLNVDYSRFDNFIHFGSAQARIENFVEKIKLIEYYQDIIDSVSTDLNGLAYSALTGSSYYITQKNTYQSKIETIKGAFDGFERYMYYQSSSYVSNSFGEFGDFSWPKSTSTKPYILYPATSSQVENWLTSTLTSASLYDQNNSHALTNYIPSHILEDDGSEITTTFVNMIGHFFDTQYAYVDQITKLYSRNNSLTEGFAKELVHYVAESLGADFDNGTSIEDLWSYTLGYNTSGSFDNGLQLSAQDRTQEIWKRIINNLPYLMKTRGTERGLRALINCFGIPSTILRIKEFGGPEPDFDTQSTFDHDRFYYSLLVGSGSSYGSVKWTGQSSAGANTGPKALELRFKSDAIITGSAAIYRLAHLTYPVSPFYPALYQLNTGRDNVGDYVQLFISGSNNSAKAYISSSLSTKLFDGNWVNVLVEYNGYANFSTQTTASYNLFVGQKSNYTETPLISSASISWQTNSAQYHINDQYGWYGATYLELGTGSAYMGRATASLSGSIQEIRLWGGIATATQNTAIGLCLTGGINLEQSPFYAHIISPTTIVGSNYYDRSWTGSTSSFNDLSFRLALGTNNVKVNLNTTSSLSGSQPNQNYASRSGSFFNYSSNPSTYWQPIVESNYMPWPDLGGNRVVSNKIRVDETFQPSTELFWNRKTAVGLQDTQPTDSARLGLYFSTADQVNEDIAEQFGGIHLDDYVGGFGVLYNESYDDLEQIQRAYLQKYGWNPSRTFSGITSARFNSQNYIRLISNFDGALFSLAKKFVPYRANFQTGLVVESHVLHRPKVGGYRKPTWEDLTYDANIDIPDQTQTVGGAVQDAAGGGQAHYVWEGDIEREYVIPEGEFPVQGEGTIANLEGTSPVHAYLNEYNNSQIPEQPLGLGNLYGVGDVNYTSYGREKILGSQYDFYTWYQTGSGPFDFRYDRANARPYWDPIGIQVYDNRLSETYGSTESPYNGTDLMRGSGSFPANGILTYSGSYYGYRYGNILAMRLEAESTQLTTHYWIVSGSKLVYNHGNGTNLSASAYTPILPYELNPNLVYNVTAKVSGAFLGGTSPISASVQFAFGSKTSSYRYSYEILANPGEQTISFNTRADGPTFYINIWTSTNDAYRAFVYDLTITPQKPIPAQVQDFHCGDNAAIGQANQKYNGSKLTGTDWNVDSSDTIDGGPVVSIIEGPDVDLTVDPSSAGTYIFR